MDRSRSALLTGSSLIYWWSTTGWPPSKNSSRYPFLDKSSIWLFRSRHWDVEWSWSLWNYRFYFYPFYSLVWTLVVQGIANLVLLRWEITPLMKSLVEYISCKQDFGQSFAWFYLVPLADVDLWACLINPPHFWILFSLCFIPSNCLLFNFASFSFSITIFLFTCSYSSVYVRIKRLLKLYHSLPIFILFLSPLSTYGWMPRDLGLLGGIF